MTLTFLGHSTVRVELAGRTVLTDPLLTGRVGPLRRVVPPLPPPTWAGVDLVLLSHLHGDHLHLPSLRLLGRGTPVVVPRGAGRWLRGKGFTDVTELAPGQELTDGGLTVTGVPADHSGHRWGPRSTHGPDAAAMGHLVTGDGTTVYAAGDTDVLPGMADLGPVDVALLPVWGWGTTLGPGHMDPAGAALACSLLRPRAAVPVHWGTLALPGVAGTRRMRSLLVDPPRRFAADVAAADLATRVLVTEPGHRVAWP
ncbi:MBL fold metallo-hydrolase [Klenkia sp. LSe6-5]|uniref:MBL fold metallo-hydrolase n=1 Tax=Klenkia sesuvii TaxID=3103137 RepID=A0ABU8DVG4_9ACTN